MVPPTLPGQIGGHEGTMGLIVLLLLMLKLLTIEQASVKSYPMARV